MLSERSQIQTITHYNLNNTLEVAKLDHINGCQRQGLGKDTDYKVALRRIWGDEMFYILVVVLITGLYVFDQHHQLYT